MRRRHLRQVLAAVAAAALLGGCGSDDPEAAPPRPAQATPELPAPDKAVPEDAPALARELAGVIGELRANDWDVTKPVPADVELLALWHQRLFRSLVDRSDAHRSAVLRALPVSVRGEVRDTVAARRAIAQIPRSTGKLPRLRTAAAAPLAELQAAFTRAQKRFGVRASTLASVMFVESAFGRVRSASEAGARGPMQFLPATWRAYGLGGDIDDAGDAILGAANYLRRSGAPRDEDRALFAYNRSTSYVRAIRTFSRRIAADPRVLRTYYAWQVYARTSDGVRRLTGPGRATASSPSA